MTTTADPILEAWPSGEPQGERSAIAGRTPCQLFWERFREDRVALVALGFIVLEILLAIFAPLDREARSAHPPNAQYPRDARPPLRDADRPLADVPVRRRLGRARRLLARRSTARASRSRSRSSRPRSPSCSASSLGLIAGYYRGATDTVISRVIDVTLAFPILLLALGIASACSLGNGCAGGLIKPGLTTVIVAIVVINWTYIGRIIRGQVLSLREKEFVEAARAAGAGRPTILFREILPNLVGADRRLHDARHPAEHPARGRALLPRRRHQPATGELGRDDRRGHADLRHRLVVLRSSRGSRCSSPCSRSTCSATGSATPSTRTAA